MSDVDVRLSELERRVARLEQLRTEDSGLRTESHHPETVAARETELSPHSPVLTPPVVPSPPLESNLLLAGRSLIALGGAYLLRALAESKVLPIATAVAIGFAYAAVWLWRSSDHARHSRRAHAAFCAAIAAVIAYPIIWESTTRFALFNSAAAAGPPSPE